MVEYSETIPIQYEQGEARFMGMDVLVDPSVLIPRPETELLVRTAASLLTEKGQEEPLIVDMGTGSGAVSMGLARLMPDCRIIACDVSAEALMVAEKNIHRYGYLDRVALLRTDMFKRLGDENEGVVDAVVSNPPYVSDTDYEKLDAWVKAEPQIALKSGPEGMDHLSVLAAESGRFLKPGGIIAVEVAYDQAERVKRLFQGQGFERVTGYRDLNGYERVITGYRNG